MNNDSSFMAGDVTILIVEDSVTQRYILRQLLECHDFKVISASNGREAIDQLAASIPTLVITDISMPEMDGYELCRRIKDCPEWNQIPVILLTSLTNPRDILRGLECGADNFTFKPYEEEFLLSRIRYVLANLELRRGAAGEEATEVYFAGHKYKFTTDRIRSIDLLLSTYETAVQKNLELTKAKEQVELQAEELREKNTQMNEDLAMARELQTAFLPRFFPVFPSLGVSGKVHPPVLPPLFNDDRIGRGFLRHPRGLRHGRRCSRLRRDGSRRASGARDGHRAGACRGAQTVRR